MQRYLMIAILLSTAGCFPVELDVTAKAELLIYRQEGLFLLDPATKQARPILGPGADLPVFARFAPNGQEILAVVKEDGSEEHRFDLVSLADGSAKVICKRSNCGYARFSPGGDALALTHLAWKTIKST